MTGGFNHLGRIGDEMRRNLEMAMQAGAEEILSEAALRMSDAKSGRVYRSGRTGKEHQASAPGEAPAIDTAGLVGSLHIEADIGRWTWVVYTNQEYAAGLEFGRTDGRMAARPFLRPAAKAKREGIIRRLRGVLQAR